MLLDSPLFLFALLKYQISAFSPDIESLLIRPIHELNAPTTRLVRRVRVVTQPWLIRSGVNWNIIGTAVDKCGGRFLTTYDPTWVTP